MGADKELSELVQLLDKNKIKMLTANKGVEWDFNPPLAPYFGGVHEVMIKAARRAILAILGIADVTDEELMMTIIGVEGLINSRLLTYQSAHPSDDTPLTPNHFIHGQIGGDFAPQSADETVFNVRKRWRRVQELVRHFWQRWIKEWLPSISSTRKWKNATADLKVGEVVLVMSSDHQRGHWKLGRNREVFPGVDGHVRVVRVMIGENEYLRSINNLVQLECDA